MNPQETPLLEKIIFDAIRQESMRIRVMFPVRVEKYYSDTQKVDVVPLLKKKYTDGTESLLPVISDVPIEWPVVNNGKSYIIMPLKAGDTGKVVFCDRSLDRWLAGDGSPTSPLDPRIHDLSDCVFWPGMRPFKKSIKVDDSNNLYVTNDQMMIELFPDGKVRIKGGSKELINILSSWMGHVISGKILTGTAVGVWLTSTSTQLQSDKSGLDSLKV